MTTFLEGTAIDLDRVQVAVDDSHWLWTCDVSETGEPLMARIDGPQRTVLPLASVLLAHGPVAPERQPTTAADCRRALEAA
ncbi:predicted protein [Streptomyces viridosporus ATCC 14672]|uniref:Predicted protein n=1 Tax=Streptomyces viridosporus (strain ATCC 14672 / DSM 40746 / JCM 4963 / KCTC 9882 / NRRL B-12104 / FH 1290) TaxID=566461 RepID=D6A4L0_STRV1|nr:phiSA1p31-related protein [Streptomyces viridosporus]EFE65850.1 predicted protein [Streptomyces viridosporus ATCC 14672]